MPMSTGGSFAIKGIRSCRDKRLRNTIVAPVIHPHRVKHALCDIDPEYAHLLFHWTRLLWLNGFTDRELIVAHRSRSAQGRVHFITTSLPVPSELMGAAVPIESNAEDE